MGQPRTLHCGTILWGGVQQGTLLLAGLLLPVTSSITHKKIGAFWRWFPGEWFCVRSRTLWVSPRNSPVRLRVCPTAATPTGFFSQRFWGFIFLHWDPRLSGLSHSPVVPPGLSTCKCFFKPHSTSHHLTWSAKHSHLALSPLYPSCLSPPLLPVWMNGSSLTPWLSDFHTVLFSGSSGCFLFLNLLSSFFCLWKEA